MLGISAGLESKTVAWSVFFPLRSFIKSMAENVRCRPGGGRGGGGGGGGRLPEGGGCGGTPVIAAGATKGRGEKIVGWTTQRSAAI